MNFMVEFSIISEEVSLAWILLVDGASNVKGSGTGVVLVGLEGLLI